MMPADTAGADDQEQRADLHPGGALGAERAVLFRFAPPWGFPRFVCKPSCAPKVTASAGLQAHTCHICMNLKSPRWRPPCTPCGRGGAGTQQAAHPSQPAAGAPAQTANRHTLILLTDYPYMSLMSAAGLPACTACSEQACAACVPQKTRQRRLFCMKG